MKNDENVKMTFERLMWIGAQFEDALKHLIELDEKFGKELKGLHNENFTLEELKLIERKNDDLDKLLYVLKKYC